MNVKTVLNLSTIAMFLALPLKASNILLKDSFEKNFDSWKIYRANTDCSVSIVRGGAASSKCVEIKEKNSGGIVSLKKKIAVEGGKWYSLSLSLKSLSFLSNAEFYTIVRQFNSSGKTVGRMEKTAFLDGISAPSHFGGKYKVPQTMGEWKIHKQYIKTTAQTKKIEISVVFDNNACHFLLDNIILIDEGKTKPRKTVPPVFVKAISTPGATTVKTEQLTPGFTYRIKLDTDTANHKGMGLSMRWKNLQGEFSNPITIPMVSKEGKSIFFDVQIPYTAMSQEFYLMNDDLGRYSRWGEPKKYRNFTKMTVNLLYRLPMQDIRFDLYRNNFEKNADNILYEKLVKISDFEKKALAATVAKREIHETQVVIHNGGAAFQIGEEIIPPVFIASMPLNPRRKFAYFKAHEKRGINIVRVANAYGGSALSGQWSAPGEFDFSNLDEQIYRALKQNPKAFIILHTDGLHPPPWWGNSHPEELVRDFDGNVILIRNVLGLANSIIAKFRKDSLIKELNGRNKMYELKDTITFFSSIASEKYREVMKEYLTALRQYIEKQPYAAAVIGYKLVWGYDQQWGIPLQKSRYYHGKGKKMSKATLFFTHDYSLPMKSAFRRYLKEKYKTVEKLRKAWKNDNVTFKSAKIPSPAERTLKVDLHKKSSKKSKWPFIYEPSLGRQNVTDFNTLYSSNVGSLLTDMGKALKEAHPRKIITGAYFSSFVRDLGHDKVIKSPYIDFVGGPIYEANTIGLAGSFPLYLDSWRLHNKLALYEFDDRLFSFNYQGFKGAEVADTPKKSYDNIKREFSKYICRGGGLWLFDIGIMTLSQPLIADMLGKAQAVFKNTISLDKSSIARIAAFIPAEHYAATTPYPGRRSKILGARAISIMSHAGIPIDTYRMCDLDEVKNKYSIFLFPVSYKLTKNYIKIINSLKKDGNILVFGPGAGYIIGQQEASAKQIESLLGMKIGIDNSLSWHIRVNQRAHQLTRKLPKFIGSINDQSHIEYLSYYVTDPKAVPLGTNVSHKDKVTFAYKNHGSWQSVYYGSAGYFPPSFYRSLGQLKGLHIYSSTDDAMFFSKEVVGIHANKSGMKTINLPYACHVKSLWDNKDIGIVKQIKRYMRVGDTALYSCVKK